MGLNMFLPSTLRTVIIFIWTFPHPHLSISLSSAVTAQETFIDKYSYCSCVYLLGHHCCNLLVIFLRQAASQFMNWYQRCNYFIYFVYACTVLSIQMSCLFHSTIHQNACREYSLAHLLSVYIRTILPLQMACLFLL